MIMLHVKVSSNCDRPT